MPANITPELRHTLLGILARGTLAGRYSGCPTVPEEPLAPVSLADRLETYHRQLALDHSQHYVKESRRLLGLYAVSLGDAAPDHASALAFLEGHVDRADSTRATYVAYFNRFFRYLGLRPEDLRRAVDRLHAHRSAHLMRR